VGQLQSLCVFNLPLPSPQVSLFIKSWRIWSIAIEASPFPTADHATRSLWQAGENDKLAAPQNPPSKFPTALASVVMVFETDAEWRGEEQGISYAKMGMQAQILKRTSHSDFMYRKCTMALTGQNFWQVIVDKLRSADMIVREVMSTNKKNMYALISVSEKRQRVVAEIMENRQKFPKVLHLVT